MRTQSFAIACLLTTSAFAAEWTRVDISTDTLRSVRARQEGDSFKPGQTSNFGQSCEDAFGGGYVQCGTGTVCYNPTAGQPCCSGKYACPSDAFCLTAGYCCPDGLDPETCAKQFGVSVPPTTTYPPPTITEAYSTAPPPPSSTGSNYTVTPTTGGVSPTATPPPFFTGAANPQSVATGAVAVLGLFGFLQNLL
ncbi:hypothetical protein AJ79_01602 [Helicocarpus griseus UAMH5409]|uniref:Granulins domain-containing protein n=1 Tax=Helicocarpus griseus UAMH5409 TaxID=1447875 RepID=A0A2B7Y6I7_9EURO|nr:hypothetical protein AJ79_01602 [Helicocarpus griseus UAMH5409]